MIERKIDEAGNIVGYWDAEQLKWTKNDSYDYSTRVDGTRLTSEEADHLIDEQTERLEKVQDRAGNPPDPDEQYDGENDDTIVQPNRTPANPDAPDEVNGDVVEEVPPLDQDPSTLNKAQLKAALKARNILFPKDATKDQMVEIYNQNKDDLQDTDGEPLATDADDGNEPQ